MIRSIMPSLVALCLAAAVSFAAEPKLIPLDDSSDVPAEPRERGGFYKFSTKVNLRKRTLFGWKLELPDGRGLGFGGLATWSVQERNGTLQRTDDPLVHTQVLRDGKWVFIDDELRKKNPLQSLHDRVWELRRDLPLITAQARQIYFEGREPEAEKRVVAERLAPRIAAFLPKLTAVREALAKAAPRDAYQAGQVKLALSRLDTAFPALDGFGPLTTHENLAALRQARIAIERAADPLNAEPPARVLSAPAYDARTGLFAIFGGDHFDFLLNDLWIFDPKAERWEQRHPATPAPEPRAEHTGRGPRSPWSA